MIPASSPVIIIESGNNSMKYMYSKLAGTTTRGGGGEISMHKGGEFKPQPQFCMLIILLLVR